MSTSSALSTCILVVRTSRAVMAMESERANEQITGVESARVHQVGRRRQTERANGRAHIHRCFRVVPAVSVLAFLANFNCEFDDCANFPLQTLLWRAIVRERKSARERNDMPAHSCIYCKRASINNGLLKLFLHKIDQSEVKRIVSPVEQIIAR